MARRPSPEAQPSVIRAATSDVHFATRAKTLWSGTPCKMRSLISPKRSEVQSGRHFASVTLLTHLQHDSSVGLRCCLRFQLGKLRNREETTGVHIPK